MSSIADFLSSLPAPGLMYNNGLIVLLIMIIKNCFFFVVQERAANVIM